MSLLDEISTYLEAQGLGTIGTSIFMARLNDQDVAAFAIGLFQAQGLAGHLIHDAPGVAYQQPRLDVLVRGAVNQFAAALTRAQAIHDCLAAVNSQALSGTYYVAIDPVTPPYDAGMDMHARPLILARYLVTKEAS